MDRTATPIGARRATLATEVRGEIETMIVSGELAAGEKLNEVILAGVLGVSRGTVREAIRSLADSGLIDVIANRGAFVHRTTLDEVRNLYDLRGAIFGMACAAAARRVRDGQEPDLPQRLTENIAAMRKVRDRDDRAAYYELNIAFHDLLLAAAGNPKAVAMYANLIKGTHLFRRRGLSLATNVARSLDEHQAIAAAVSAGDEAAARGAALTHIATALQRYLRLAGNDAGTRAADGAG